MCLFSLHVMTDFLMVVVPDFCRNRIVAHYLPRCGNATFKFLSALKFICLPHIYLTRFNKFQQGCSLPHVFQQTKSNVVLISNPRQSPYLATTETRRFCSFTLFYFICFNCFYTVRELYNLSAGYGIEKRKRLK